MCISLGVLNFLYYTGQENPLTILNYAHLFALDHFIGTTYTVFFGVIWWVYHPHDGKREVHSDAQREILEKSAHPSNLDPEQQRLAAQTIWTSERGFSLVVLCGSWLIKIYFILCIYSFALHLRRGSYRHLAASASGANKSASPAPASQARRRSAQYVYSHVRNDSRASEGVEDESESLELERVDVSQSLARPPIPKLEEVPPSPADTAPASTDPALQFVKGSPVTSTVAFGVAAPTLMRSRSASDTKSDAMA